MRVVVLGCGKIGSVMARDFAKSVQDSKITMCDISEKRAKVEASVIPDADWKIIDATNHSSLVKAIYGSDLVLSALPGDYGYNALKATIEVGVDIVDVSYTPEDPTQLDETANEAGITVIPDCGVAPGLSNLLVGYSASRLDTVQEAKIMVGGVPETPIPPLGYTITWSAEGLIDEYVRDVSIIKDGDLLQKTALSGLEKIDFPGVGEMEAFYTDGLRSLITSFPDVENMFEKTLRYPGHVEKIKLLRELGFFSDEPIDVLGQMVTPKLLTARLLERSLWKPEVGDLLAMLIEVIGVKDERPIKIRHRVLEYYDHQNKVSAMARTTAYTGSIIAQLLIHGGIKEKGVILMEQLGQNHDIVNKLFSELAHRDVKIIEY